MLVLVASILTLIATTLASIVGIAALTLLLAVPVVVLLVAASSGVVLLALVIALLGGTLVVPHAGHELLDDVGDLVHVSGVDCAVTIFLEMTLEVLLVLVVLVFKVAVLFDLVVVHVEGFVVHHEILLVFSDLGLVGSFEANEGVGALAILGFKNAAGLNLTKLTENVSEV